jgi:hypothetical protein
MELAKLGVLAFWLLPCYKADLIRGSTLPFKMHQTCVHHAHKNLTLISGFPLPSSGTAGFQQKLSSDMRNEHTTAYRKYTG